MAFDGHQRKHANSVFHTYQRQAGVNVGDGGSGRVALPYVSFTSAALQEQDTASHVPWSHNTRDDPYELTICMQAGIKNRKPSDNAECDGEADLQGIVSNILDEADSQDSYYSEGSIPTCNPIWSPKTLGEELLQYFQLESKTQHNPFFPINYVTHETFSEAQKQSVNKDFEELNQQPNGLAANQQWPFNLPNGDSYSLHSQKLPPGLPMPNTGNTYLPQMQQSKHASTSASNDRGNGQSMNNFPDLSGTFKPQSEMNNAGYGSFYEDHSSQSSSKPIFKERYASEDINQLVSSFQSFMACEYDSTSRGEFPNMHKQTVGMHHEDSMTEQWKITCPALSTQSIPAMQIPKQLLGESATLQCERNGGVRKQTFKRDAFQDQPDFSPQNTEYLQQPKPFSAPFNLPNQYQNNMSMHRGNINVSMNQYSQHHIQPSQIQNKMKPQMHKEKKRTHMSGFLGEGFSMIPQTNTYMREGDKQPFSQNPHFDFLGNTQTQRFDGENGTVSAGDMQQLMPFMYPVNDVRRHSSIPINSNFSSRFTQPHGSGVFGVDVGGIMSASEYAAFNPYVSDMKTHREESTYYGMVSAMTSPVLMNQEGPVIQFHFYLESCYEQWRCLESERKRMEVVLSKTFLGKRVAAVTNTNLPKKPPNPTKVNLLIFYQLREQAKVASLLDGMESLCGIPLPVNIHTALNRHHMAISITQARCREDTVNTTTHQRQRPHFTEDRDALLMVIALKDLAATTGKLRTALWCALQMTLPKPVKTLDHHVNQEATSGESCSSLFEGYSYRL